ncbi:hypothetical protein DPEC_G00263900 [Dallia pectoralis]|uniref:Uncharacterized protein n=1 Tax=Dallia pectoralis TaxID=75939 RepID=A0ACC2FSE3_DALPE|nr:hypothetical protein DPEC_G00263900 [Dallia pectoralis]
MPSSIGTEEKESSLSADHSQALPNTILPQIGFSSSPPSLLGWAAFLSHDPARCLSASTDPVTTATATKYTAPARLYFPPLPFFITADSHMRTPAQL